MAADTPRTSSIASRHRGPSSLRIPSGPRRASNPHLSLIFAQGGSTLSPIEAYPSTAKRLGTHTSLSEQSLSRQLDGDLGGKQMGLRSRRSSSATVQTIHTPAGIRSPSPSHSMKEVNEEEAGPSTAPSASADHSLHPDDRSKSPQRLNLKSSTSWLRWNAPVPSFPKPAVAGDKGKGKEALMEEAAPHPQLVDIGQDPIHSQRPAQLPAQIGMQSEAPAAPSFAPPRPRPPDPLEEVASVSPPTVVPVKSRGWFTRLPLEPTTKPKENPPIAAAENDSSNASSVPPVVDASASSAPGPSPSAFSPSDLPPVTLGSPPDDATPSRIPASLAQRSENGGKGWQVFLWGSEGRGTATERKGSSTTTPPTEPPHKNKTEVGESIRVPTERSSGVPACSVTDTSPPEAATAVEPPTVPVETTSKPGWSNYLYSFVAPPRSVADLAEMPSQPTSHIVEPTSPTTDQKPIPIEGPTLSVDPASSGPTTNTEPLSNRRPSTSGSAGWLNYLALPYAQKKLASSDASSTKTGESVVGGRKFVDGVGEEVMDLSGDPNFPNSPPSSVTKLEDNPQPVSTKGAKPRQYSSSNRSVGSKTPQPSSPKAQSSLDGKIPSAPASSKMQCSSSLPLPPPSLAVQPNLAIPSFAMTFDRPPRSFLPQQASSTSATQTGKGATAATTGLAWKAFGAVGGYVYGGAPEPPKPTSDSLTEDEKETRGRKEGRGVGADLPRRIGLGSGSPDDGWKGVKRVVVVGVHGWFPAKMLNSVIGEPTGTSAKFSTMMGQAVKAFFDERGVDDLRLTLMPLEGEGTIDHRVDKLYKAYLSSPAWVNDLRRADAVFFAAHSQGCIVTIHLISRLIAQGHIRTASNAEAVSRCEWAFGPIGLVPSEEPRGGRRAPTLPVTGADGGHQRVAMLSMCGVHLGPMHSISTSTVIQPYLQWFENAAARELFEFQDTASPVSVAYQRALAMVLENGVRVVLLASLNDQVVPIYGASFSTATHPLLLRALFVDGASYTASDFMTNLLCFAFMLRNAGIDDQRLVEHLSEATAGSLTGVGHSTPYEEPGCYNLAVDYLFLAGPARHPLPPLSVDTFSARDARNDFELPWIMRALVDAREIKDLFPGELRDLKEGILHWKPVTKVLKEIKRRLEPMAGRKSRLQSMATSPSSTSLASTSESPLLGTSLSSGKLPPKSCL